MCKHGGQGVNDCGNDIYMWYCSIREHDLVRRFVDLTYVKVHVTVYIYIVCFRVVAADALCLLAMDTRVYAAVSRSLLFIHDIRKIMKYKMLWRAYGVAWCEVGNRPFSKSFVSTVQLINLLRIR